MAASRLEKIGTIYTRALGLIESGAKRWEDRPLWFDIYEAFPPKEEPTYTRPAPNLQLKPIFYHEDKIRALFHKRNKYLGITNISNRSTKTLSQKFIDCYEKIEKKYGETEVDQETIYSEAIELLRREKEAQQELKSLNSSPKTDKKVNISEIFQ